MVVNKVQTFGIDKKSLLDIHKSIYEEAINEYNSQYGTDYSLHSLPDYLQEYLEAFVAVTLFGWADISNKGYSAATVDLLKSVFGNEAEQYQGINQSIQDQLSDKELDQVDPNAFAKDRADKLFGGLFGSFNVVMVSLAVADKRDNLIGAITMNDGKVRDTHIPNHRRYWRKGLQQPWFDFNCRCSYFFFKTEAEAKAAGFTKL